MEQVLEIYQKPYDPERPVVCMDEQPVQLVKETRVRRYRGSDASTTSTNGAGTASIFMFCEALSSWRRATARKRRTKADWAEEVADLLEGRYADCEKIILVCDNLNTHTPGAFYEASCAGAGVGQASLLHAEARELAEHRGERTQDPAVPAPPSARRPRDPPGGSVVRRRQRAAARRGLANEG